MRIRNSYLPPPPSTLSPVSPKRLHCSDDDQITFDRSPESAPHVMISRINGRINNSTSRVFINQGQNEGISHEEEEEKNFTTGNQSLEGGWREEEKAMPLKKRRKVSSSSSEERMRESEDRGKMVKVDEDLMRCVRTDGRRWRCSGTRVEGYSMCEHHLMTRSARYRSENLKREIDEEGDEKKKDEGCFGKCENGDGSNNNKRKVAKATRSINSLLRDTV